MSPSTHRRPVLFAATKACMHRQPLAPGARPQPKASAAHLGEKDVLVQGGIREALQGSQRPFLVGPVSVKIRDPAGDASGGCVTVSSFVSADPDTSHGPAPDPTQTAPYSRGLTGGSLRHALKGGIIQLLEATRRGGQGQHDGGGDQEPAHVEQIDGVSRSLSGGLIVREGRLSTI